MATQGPKVSLSELQERYPLSATVKRLLDSAYLARDKEQQTLDIASFLHSAATQPGSAGDRDVSAHLFGAAAREHRFDRLLALGGPKLSRRSGVVLSPGLLGAVNYAQQIVEATRRTSTLVRRRYVVLAILAPRLPPIIDELEPVLSATGVDGRKAQYEIARYCIDTFDHFDDRAAWNQLFREWGLAELQQPETSTRSGVGTPKVDLAPPHPSSSSSEGGSQFGTPTATQTDPPSASESIVSPTPPASGAQASVDEPPPPPPQPETMAPGIPLCDPDDPWAIGLVDKSGADREAVAFARMILTRQFKPPLAVGVFGDWGSGKSFFMRLVYDEIHRRAAETRTSGEQTDKLTFLSNVVQIRFNAWHYAETNLWASLVDHIFRELDGWAERYKPHLADRLFDQLVTARRLTVESAELLVKRRRERNDAALKVKQTQDALLQSQEKAERSSAALVQTIWKDLLERATPDSLARLQHLGIESVEKNAGELRSAVTALQTEAGRSALFRSGLVRSIGSTSFILLLIGGTLLVPIALEKLGACLNIALAPATAAIAGIAASISTALGLASRSVNGALNYLKDLSGKFDAQLRARTLPQQQDLDRAEEAVQRSESEVREAAERLDAASTRVADAARDYNAQTGRSRLLRFVRERVANGDYAKHLGFVATVRKDFEELDRLMQAPSGESPASDEAHEAFGKHVARVLIEAGSELTSQERDKLLATTVKEDDVGQAFDRIVLYVDDLDRCPTDKVVDVLQAVHLLLTFQLFAVFVAVDVRWLRKALARHYTGQLSVDESRSVSATAGDYLEKIFQIPYWVRPMEPEGTRGIIADRIGPVALDPTPAVERGQVGSDARGEPAASVGSATATPQSPRASGLDLVPPREINANALRITEREKTFILRIADVLDGSPRRALRFINTYRVLKASLPDQDVTALEQEGYAALVALLALSIASSSIYPRLVTAIRQSAGAQTPIADALLTLSGIAQTDQERLAHAHRLLSAERTNPSFLATYSGLVERFTFCTRSR
jgi:hypothetical protein